MLSHPHPGNRGYPSRQPGSRAGRPRAAGPGWKASNWASTAREMPKVISEVISATQRAEIFLFLAQEQDNQHAHQGEEGYQGQGMQKIDHDVHPEFSSLRMLAAESFSEQARHLDRIYLMQVPRTIRYPRIIPRPRKSPGHSCAHNQSGCGAGNRQMPGQASARPLAIPSMTPRSMCTAKQAGEHVEAASNHHIVEPVMPEAPIDHIRQEARQRDIGIEDQRPVELIDPVFILQHSEDWTDIRCAGDHRGAWRPACAQNSS